MISQIYFLGEGHYDTKDSNKKRKALTKDSDFLF